LVFLDPPYDSDLALWAMQELENKELLSPGALLVVEHPSKTKISPTEGLRLHRYKQYGDTGLSIFAREE